MNREEFRRAGHAWIDWLAELPDEVAQLPVSPLANPGEFASRLPKAPPELPTGIDERLWKDLLRDGTTWWSHPRFFAWFPANTSRASVLADLVGAGVGGQAMTWLSAPAQTELEGVATSWFRQAVGLSEGMTGVINDTASTSTLTALVAARERCGPGRLAVYGSEQNHVSVPKAVRVAGFGPDAWRGIPVDMHGAISLPALDAQLAADRRSGTRACAIVAATGTTTSTAFDPVDALADRAEANGAWLHVDAAMAGNAMVAPENRRLWTGVERADSLVINPHKWLGVGMDLSILYVRDVAFLESVMSTDPTYLSSRVDGTVRHGKDLSIPLGRRPRAMKLLWTLLDEGVEGWRTRVRRDMALARDFARAAPPPWRLAAPVQLQTVLLHHGDRRDEGAIVERINASGRFLLSPANVAGAPVVRVSVGAEGNTAHDLDLLWEALVDAQRGAH